MSTIHAMRGVHPFGRCRQFRLCRHPLDADYEHQQGAVGLSGEWVQTIEGRYVYDQGDGWYFDHLDQAWYEGYPASTPTGAPAAATSQRFVARVTEKPDRIWWNNWKPWGEGFWGMICCLIGWVCRIAIVYSGYQIVKAYTVGSDGGWFLKRYVLGMPEPGTDAAGFAMVYGICYGALALFSFIVLGILSLNEEQSATLTTAFVAHNVYRHVVQDIGQVQENAARQHRYHPPGKLTL